MVADRELEKRLKSYFVQGVDIAMTHGYAGGNMETFVQKFVEQVRKELEQTGFPVPKLEVPVAPPEKKAKKTKEDEEGGQEEEREEGELLQRLKRENAELRKRNEELTAELERRGLRVYSCSLHNSSGVRSSMVLACPLDTVFRG